jgi:hypothetical protein
MLSEVVSLNSKVLGLKTKAKTRTEKEEQAIRAKQQEKKEKFHLLWSKAIHDVEDENKQHHGHEVDGDAKNKLHVIKDVVRFTQVSQLKELHAVCTHWHAPSAVPLSSAPFLL